MRPRASTEKPVPAVGTQDPETNNTAGRPWRRLSALPSRRQSDPDPDPDPVRPRRPCCAGKCSLWWLHVLSLALHGSGSSLPSPRPSEPRPSPVRRRGGHRQAGVPPALRARALLLPRPPRFPPSVCRPAERACSSPALLRQAPKVSWSTSACHGEFGSGSGGPQVPGALGSPSNCNPYLAILGSHEGTKVRSQTDSRAGQGHRCPGDNHHAWA